jgi:hydrogenase expression/formation protein HypC
MCLAIPARIVTIEDGRMATVDIMGVTRKVSLDLVPEASEGDYVLVHAGFALQVVDEQYANETLEILKSIPDFAADEGIALEGA